MHYGVLPAKIDLRDYKICSSNVQQEYPKEFALDNLPIVKNQQDVNSCCAHATSSILEYFAQNKERLSTNFIYGSQKKLYNQCMPGMYLKDALSTAKDYGDAELLDCPCNNEVPECYKIAERTLNDKDKMDRAYKYRIDSYYLCASNNDIKYALMHYGPVLGAVMWHDEFTVDNDGIVYFNTKSSGGGHAIMIYGWNTKGWLIQNSWGEEFANKGRFILPYSYGLLEARAVIDHDNSEDDVVCYKPKNSNKLTNFIYKIANSIVNHFNEN